MAALNAPKVLLERQAKTASLVPKGQTVVLVVQLYPCMEEVYLDLQGHPEILDHLENRENLAYLEIQDLMELLQQAYLAHQEPLAHPASLGLLERTEVPRVRHNLDRLVLLGHLAFKDHLELMGCRERLER